MRLDKTNSIIQLNRVAQKYDHYALVPKKMAYQLFAHIDRSSLSPVIVELGCGTGFLTQLLLRSLRPKKLVAIDIAEKMIQQAQKQVVSAESVDWIVGDIEEMGWAQPASVDLVISNAVLHWVNDPLHVLKECWQSLRIGGDCVHTMVGPDTFQELRILFQQVEMGMEIPPAMHHYPLRSAKDWEAIYHKAGFTKVTVVEHWHRVEYPDCRSFLLAIKGMGASVSPAKQNLYTSYRVLLQVMQKYNLAYRSKTGVYATFHMIQCTATKE